jgi:magnesium transporter
MNATLDQQDRSVTDAAAILRDEDGAIRPEFLERVSTAIGHGAAAMLQQIAGDLHESDMGDLIEALDPELRPRFVELMGREFDFTALTEVEETVREEILEELPSETVAKGVRDLDSDAAAQIIEALPEAEQAEVLEQLPPSERGAVEQILHYPEESAGRRMRTEFIAVSPYWTVGDAIDHMREPPICRTGFSSSTSSTISRSFSARSASTACCGPSGRSRSPT